MVHGTVLPEWKVRVKPDAPLVLVLSGGGVKVSRLTQPSNTALFLKIVTAQDFIGNK